MSLEDIDTLFGSTAGQEDLRIKHQVRCQLRLSLSLAPVMDFIGYSLVLLVCDSRHLLCSLSQCRSSASLGCTT